MDVMIDIETLATRNDAAVLSIGACMFHSYADFVDRSTMRLVSIDPEYYTALREAEDYHKAAHRYYVCPNTQNWWAQQGEAAQEALSINVVPTMKDALNWLHTWFEEYRFLKHGKQDSTYRVWANPPQFDLSILRHAASIELGNDNEVPWHYRQETCARTHSFLFRELFDSEEWNHARNIACSGMTPHRADHDALAQARMVQLINRRRELADVYD